MDASKMYPAGFHPVLQHILPDCSGVIKPLPRSEAIPKYYYTDFDASIFISSDRIKSDLTTLQTVPSGAASPKLAAFKIDISDMGALLQKEIFEARSDYYSKLYQALTKCRSGSRTSKSSGHSYIQ